MRKVLAATRMVFSCAFIALYLVVVGTPVLTYCRITRQPELGLYLTWILDRIVLYFNGIRIVVEGMEKIPKGQGCIFIANHRSLLDTLVTYRVLPGDKRFLAKKELFSIPLMSFAMRTMGMIEVDRTNHEAATRSIARAASELSGGRSIIMFPEGTRSRTQDMLPFKKGAFVLAIQAQVPIVPMTMIGTDRLLEPDTPWLYPGVIRVLVHDPIHTAGLTVDERGGLLERARNVIEKSWIEHREEATAKAR